MGDDENDATGLVDEDGQGRTNVSEHSVDATMAEYPVWKVYWPRPFKAWALLIAMFLFAVGLLGIHSLVSGIRDGEWGIAIGGAAFAVGMSLPCSASIGFAGLTSSRASRSVVCVSHADHGVGMLLRCKSSRFLAVGFSAVVMWAFTAAAMQFSEASASLLPSSRDNDGGGVLVLGIGVVALAFVVLLAFRERIDVALHESGISRRVRRRRLLTTRSSEEFLRWEDIGAIQADTYDVHTNINTIENPIIRVVSLKLDSTRKMERFDTNNSIALRAYELGVEPNALMTLLIWCHENPESRGRVAQPDARDLLRAPPLRERLRLSREAVKTRSE